VYLSNVWQNRPLIFRTRLLAFAFVTTGRLLHADDQPVSSDGYKTVPINVGGKTVPIRVQESGDPYKNVSSSNSDGKYHPEQIFSTTSSMADKKFSFASNSLSKSDPDFKNSDQSTFITKSYTGDPSSPSVPNLDAKAGFPTTSAYSRNAAGFDKSYLTSNADAGQNRTAWVASATSTDQNRTALLGAQTTDIFASPLAGKTFQGPEADAAKRHLIRLNNGQISITDLPNRPLTIDEVRDLINHGFKPNTDIKPEEPSKPLNDPNYKPEPLRDAPSPDTSSSTSDDDKNDPVPPPGTMAAPQAPENSEPLPQP
jgi:hypothetical protein